MYRTLLDLLLVVALPLGGPMLSCSVVHFWLLEELYWRLFFEPSSFSFFQTWKQVENVVKVETHVWVGAKSFWANNCNIGNELFWWSQIGHTYWSAIGSSKHITWWYQTGWVCNWIVVLGFAVLPLIYLYLLKWLIKLIWKLGGKSITLFSLL